MLTCTDLQVSEKLPDQDKMMTPHRHMQEIWEEFKDDMQAAGSPACEICGRAWFADLFKKDPRLAHVTFVVEI